MTVQIRYHFQINATSYINEMQPEALMSNDTINVEHKLVKDSIQVPWNKSQKIFLQNISEV